MEIFRQQKDQISLLVTDVGMPGKNGLELAQEVRVLAPSLKVLFISGHLDKIASHPNQLKQGAIFLQKPFTSSVFMQKISEVLVEKAA